MDFEFAIYRDWIDAQANNFLAPFLPKQQLSFSLSPSKQAFKIGFEEERLEEEWRMSMNNENGYLNEDFHSNKSPKICQKCGAQWDQSQPQLYNLFVCLFLNKKKYWEVKGCT